MKDALMVVSEQLGVNSDLRALQEYFDKHPSGKSIESNCPIRWKDETHFHWDKHPMERWQFVAPFDIGSQLTLKFNSLAIQVIVLKLEEIEYEIDNEYGSFPCSAHSVLKVGGDFSNLINEKLEAGALCIFSGPFGSYYDKDWAESETYRRVSEFRKLFGGAA